MQMFTHNMEAAPVQRLCVLVGQLGDRLDLSGGSLKLPMCAFALLCLHSSHKLPDTMMLLHVRHVCNKHLIQRMGCGYHKNCFEVSSIYVSGQHSGVNDSLLPAGLTLKLTFFPDTASGTSKDTAKQKKDDSLL